jgi:6-pyruvoyltetrahydropterin/6-carboxytetrahydropterin synthase
MYHIAVTQHFDAAHYLRGYQGKCESLHGHRFLIRVELAAPELDATGLAFDFTLLKKYLNEVLDNFDHHCLNELPCFKDINPSSENIARTVSQEITARLKNTSARLKQVTVWESPDSSASYIPD